MLVVRRNTLGPRPTRKAALPKVPRIRKIKEPPAPPVLRIPDPSGGIDQWLILGIDPSLSRTGYAFMLVTKSDTSDTGTSARWLDVGSLKPGDSSDPVWVRSKAVALTLRQLLHKAMDELGGMRGFARTGLIISLEAPTPQNDFLTSISRILHLVLLDEATHLNAFSKVYVQMTNASTLRSLMGLTKQGAKNKVENVARAYEYLNQGLYPNLDTDACDAVLMAMMGRYSAAILLGHPEGVPTRFLTAMCNATEEVVGKGRNCRTRTKGILHRPEYWSLYERKQYDVLLRDARIKKAKLDRTTFPI